MKKIIAIILMCVFIIPLAACSKNSVDISGSPQSLYDNNKSIDFLVYKGSAYVNAKDIEWIQEIDIDSGEKLGEIKRTSVTKNFKDYDATVLPVGTEIYSVSGAQSGDMILVLIDDAPVIYYAYREG